MVRDKVLFRHRPTTPVPATPFRTSKGQGDVQVDYAQLRARSDTVAQAIADVRSTRNVMSRRRAEDGAERAAEVGRRRYKALKDREAEALLKRRIHIRMAEGSRPKTGSRTARRLFHRLVARMLKGTTGSSNARGPDGRHAIHYAFVARGFSSTYGRRWRHGETERAVLYAVREDALEGSELGWWSNIAEDRNELVGWCRTLEAIEKHDRANANVYITEIIALPAELTAHQRRQVVRRICDWFERRGLAYAVGIHLPDAAGDQRNFHLHLVFSTRPSQRLGPYEWAFGAAKQTDINTPDGIRARRSAVVRAVNATLHAARINKRYTPLSNRARGMDPPVRGKIGQQATWTARRLATQEDRQEKLAVLRNHVQRLRQGLGEAAARLVMARAKVAVRCTDMLDRIETLPAVATKLADTRAQVQRGLDARIGRIRQAQWKANGRGAATRTAVDRALGMGERRLDTTALLVKLAETRGRVAVMTDAISARVAMASAKAAERLETVRQPPTRIEPEDVGRSADAPLSPAADSARVEATPVSASVPAPAPTASSVAMHEALEARHREVCELALARLKAKRVAIRKAADGQFDVDMTGLTEQQRMALRRPSFDIALQQHLRVMYEASLRVQRPAVPAQAAPAVPPTDRVGNAVPGSVANAPTSRTGLASEEKPIEKTSGLLAQAKTVETGSSPVKAKRPRSVDLPSPNSSGRGR